MSQPDPDLAGSNALSRRLMPSMVPPVLLWAVIQIIPLVLSAARVPLWARTNHPIENDAMAMMLVVQSGGSALLFPWLMRTIRGSLLVVFMAIPFLQLAGVLAGQSVSATMSAMGESTLWLMGLAMWARVVTTFGAQANLIALASALAIGGPCIGYFSVEFGQARTESLEKAVWMVIWANFVVAAIILTLVRRQQSPTYPPEKHRLST